mgnify:CR=1 FL=1
MSTVFAFYASDSAQLDSLDARTEPILLSSWLQARENEAREQLKQLSATLAAVHEEHDSVMAALKRQQEQELRELAAERVAAVSAALEVRRQPPLRGWC